MSEFFLEEDRVILVKYRPNLQNEIDLIVGNKIIERYGYDEINEINPLLSKVKEKLKQLENEG